MAVDSPLDVTTNNYQMTGDPLSDARNRIGNLFSSQPTEEEPTVNPLVPEYPNTERQHMNDENENQEDDVDEFKDSPGESIPESKKYKQEKKSLANHIPARVTRSKHMKQSRESLTRPIPQRVTSMGVGYLGVRWPSRDDNAIEKCKEVEKRQLHRERSAKLRLIEKSARERQQLESSREMEIIKRQEVLKYQHEEKQRLDRLAKLAERERRLVEACASRQKAKLLEMKSEKARSAQAKRDEVIRNRDKQLKMKMTLKPRRTKHKGSAMQGVNSDEPGRGSESDRSGHTADAESMASTITTKATAAAGMEEAVINSELEDEAEELLVSIRKTTMEAEKQLSSSKPAHNIPKPPAAQSISARKPVGVKSAYSRVQERLNEMDELLRKLRERERGKENQRANLPKPPTQHKRTRPVEGSWMKPTVSSMMGSRSPQPRQSSSHSLSPKRTQRNTSPQKSSRSSNSRGFSSSDEGRTRSIATRSVHSRKSFEEYYHSRYAGNRGGADHFAESVSNVIDSQDEQQLLDEAGSMLASSILHPTAPSVGGYTWEALAHTMGFTSSDAVDFNQVKCKGNDGLYMKVNSLRDALSLRFRPTMHDLDTVRPTADQSEEENVTPSYMSSGVFIDQPIDNMFSHTANSLRSTTSAWEDLAAQIASSSDVASVQSHIATDMDDAEA